MILVILWLIQDLLTVFTGGGMQVPGLFMLAVVFKLLISDSSDIEEVNLRAIWTAFGGGILWDLRWIGIPGFFTLGYVVVVLIVIELWGMIPPQGRSSGTSLIVFVLFECSQLIPPMLPVLILGGRTGWNYFLMQQVYSLPAILLAMYIYLRRVRAVEKWNS
ncbi:MAG: hypothetical protein IJP85_06370 [Synergistaceae bacterium]|nr:hypothetical protein [Synergistaceae bacterium]